MLVKKNFLNNNIIKKNLIKQYNLNYNFISIYSKKSVYIKLDKLNYLYKFISSNLNLKQYKEIKLIYCPNKYIKANTERTKDSRMGGGKGNFINWLVFLKKNSLIFKIIISKKKYYKIIKFLIIKFKLLNYKLNKYFNIILHIYK